MNDFFNPDTPLMRLLSALGDLIVVNFLFLLCSLPIVTIGPALSAASRVMYDLSEHRCHSVPKTFFAAFRANFKASLGVWCVAALCFALLAVHLFMIFSGEAGALQTALLCVWMFVLLALAAVLSYLFPLIARYENSLPQHLRNAVFLAIGRFPRTVVMVLLNGFPAVFLVLAPAVFFYLVPFWVLFGFAAIFHLDMRILKPIFNQLDRRSPAA